MLRAEYAKDLTYSPDWYWSNTSPPFTRYGYFTSKGLPLDTSITVAQAYGRKDSIKFLAMTQTAGGQAALIALHIPFAEVGMATLSSPNTDWTINMNNVVFFAYNTATPPKIWATDGTSGSYACSVCGAPPALTGNGLSANLNMAGMGHKKQ